VDGLVTSDEEVRKLMLDRDAWRSRFKMIVAANKKVKLGAVKLEVLLLLFNDIVISFSRLVDVGGIAAVLLILFSKLAYCML
jgi:hypothetical protein